MALIAGASFTPGSYSGASETGTAAAKTRSRSSTLQKLQTKSRWKRILLQFYLCESCHFEEE
ncbi:hypothetical protein Ancab_019323, partial [Ancistrocladus abbreviatus]